MKPSSTATVLESYVNKTIHQISDSEINATSTETETISIDLDEVKPPIDFLYEKLTLVTSFSQNHFKEGLGFIGSAQHQMPNKTIIVYDLGLAEQATNKVICHLCPR